MRHHRSLNRLKVGILFGWILLPISGCSLGDYGQGKSYSSECLIPSDQSGTISGKWPATPVPIAFRQGDFSAEEMLEVVTAAQTWNSFFAASRGLSTIDYGSAGSPRTVSTGAGGQGFSCNNSIIAGSTSKFTGSVVIYKVPNWPATYSASAIAITNTCRYTSRPYQTIYLATMEFNYKNFFVQGAKRPDLQSIALHEFGHLMGLDHSCGTTSRAGVPNCSSSGLNPDYILASMFPLFGFDKTTGMGEVKRELGTNDQNRANCLYESKSTSP